MVKYSSLVFSLLIVNIFCFSTKSTIAQNRASIDQLGLLKSIETEFVYTGDLFANLTGGRAAGLRYMDNFDISIETDLDELASFNNTKLFLYGLGNQGGNLTELTGDAQVVSNIEAKNSWRLYEAWVQKLFPTVRLSLLFGLYDLNTEFDVINTASLFLNSSHGIGAEYAASGQNGPSIFPYTSLALRGKIALFNGFVFKAAVLDGVPGNPENTTGTNVLLRKEDGLLFAGEVNFYPGRNSNSGADPRRTRLRTWLGRHGSSKNTKIALGGWVYSEKRETFKHAEDHEYGLYALGETLLSSFNEISDLSAFIRFGIANKKVSRFSAYAGTGAVLSAPFNSRPLDRVGLALAMPFSSSNYRDELISMGLNPKEFEMNIELTYRFFITNFISIQADGQYIIHPNTLADRPNAFAFGLRTQLHI